VVAAFLDEEQYWKNSAVENKMIANEILRMVERV